MLRSVLAGMLSPRHCPRGIAVGAWRSVGDEFDMVFMRREWPAMPPAGRHVRPWLPPESRAARDRQAEGRQTQSQTVEAHERVPEPARPEGQAQGPARILGEHLQHAAARDRENRPQEPRSSVSATCPRECPWPGAVAPGDRQMSDICYACLPLRLLLEEQTLIRFSLPHAQRSDPTCIDGRDAFVVR